MWYNAANAITCISLKKYNPPSFFHFFLSCLFFYFFYFIQKIQIRGIIDKKISLKAAKNV